MKRISTTWTCLALLLSAACHLPERQHDEVGTLPVTNALRQDTEITNGYVCQVRAIQHIELRALERGYRAACSSGPCSGC